MKFAMIFDKKFFKFILVGTINTIVGSAIMFSLYNLAHLSYWLSSACNYFFGSILSFFLNKYFTFTIKEWSLFMVVAFILNTVISYLIAYGLAKPLINYFLQSKPQNIRENIALFTGMCLFTGLNYLGQRFVVFARSKNEKNLA
jgi:putative flippase GtrA